MAAAAPTTRSSARQRDPRRHRQLTPVHRAIDGATAC